MLAAFTRYSRDASVTVQGANARFLTIKAAGSAAGAVISGQRLGLARQPS